MDRRKNERASLDTHGLLPAGYNWGFINGILARRAEGREAHRQLPDEYGPQ
jgi:hypothetical protein